MLNRLCTCIHLLGQSRTMCAKRKKFYVVALTGLALLSSQLLFDEHALGTMKRRLRDYGCNKLA